jgi:hypothetical protein
MLLPFLSRSEARFLLVTYNENDLYVLQAIFYRYVSFSH